MKLNNVSFPHPVLRCNNDDIIPSLTLNDRLVEINQDDSRKYVIDVQLSMPNNTIRNFISSGQAKYVCEVDCQSTLFKHSYLSEVGHFTIELDRKMIATRMVLNFYVVVLKDIKNYVNPDANEDYEGFSFDLKPGDILVGYPEKWFEVDLKYEQLRYVSSFMVVRKALSPQEEQSTSFALDKDRIEIVLPTHLFEVYNSKIRDEYGEIMHASLASNALIYALCNLEKYYPDRKWAKAVVARLQSDDNLNRFLVDVKSDEVTIRDEIGLATEFLKDPYKRMFDYLVVYNSDEEQ